MLKKTETFKESEERIIEVEVDEEILRTRNTIRTINKSLTKLYKIKKLKNERQKRESLLTK